MTSLPPGRQAVLPPLFWLIIVLTVCHMAVLASRLELQRYLSYWMWHTTANPAGNLWLLAALAAGVVLVLWLVFRKIEGRPALKVTLLIVLGYGLQMGLGLAEGRGLDGIRDRMVSSGHAEFARIAVRQHDIPGLVRNYETLLAEGDLGRYAHSKPPGQLLLYVVTERLSRSFAADDTEGARLDALRSFAALSWPLVSMLALIPLYLLGVLLTGTERALLACAFYVMVPSVQLMTLHTDQVFFPAFFTLACYLALRALERRSLVQGVIAGVLVYLCTFSSFALAWVIPLALVAALPLWLRDAAGRTGLPGALLGLLAGLVGAALVFWWIADYNPVLRYAHAIAFHEAWKGTSPRLIPRIEYALTDVLEYAAWIGMPLFFLALYGELDAVTDLRKHELRRWLAAGVLVVTLALACSGETVGEAARLWLFLVPVTCIVAADAFLALTPSRRALGASWVFLLQLGTMYLTKRFQDFW